MGIVTLLRAARDRALGILEQAAFIDELRHARNLSLAQIAAELSRSKVWVSLRLGLIDELLWRTALFPENGSWFFQSEGGGEPGFPEAVWCMNPGRG